MLSPRFRSPRWREASHFPAVIEISSAGAERSGRAFCMLRRVLLSASSITLSNLPFNKRRIMISILSLDSHEHFSTELTQTLDMLLPVAVTLVILSSVVAAHQMWQRSPRRKVSLDRLPGPRGASCIYGNLLQIFNTGNSRMQEQWTSQFGETFKYKGWLNVR